jgi:hypothetical protein
LDRKVGERERERERRTDRKRLLFASDKIDDELTGPSGGRVAGELHVLREVGAEESTFTVAQHTIASRKTHTVRVVSVMRIIRDRHGTLLQDLRT